jgi:hypothetical protein
MEIKGDCRPISIRLWHPHRQPAGTKSLPGRWRWCDRPSLCDTQKSKRASHIGTPASSYAIMRRACPSAAPPGAARGDPTHSAISSPPWLLRLLPAGAFAGWDLDPLDGAAFSRLASRLPREEPAGESGNRGGRGRAVSPGGRGRMKPACIMRGRVQRIAEMLYCRRADRNFACRYSSDRGPERRNAEGVPVACCAPKRNR